ncbi:MAG TPA: IS200/IS605 family transposase [Gemmatimonadales bacterium]|nr:IS200/IS605 family transposase [Gemmatimonadales bacterium]
MRHRILLHIVWTTRLRAPLIDADGARFLCTTFRALAREHRAAILEIGMVSTHVHLLIRVHPLTNISTFVARMKGVSSRVAKREAICSITWGDGYNVESVSLGDEQKLRHYLRAQPYRHPEEAVPDWTGDVIGRETEAAHGLRSGA